MVAPLRSPLRRLFSGTSIPYTEPRQLLSLDMVKQQLIHNTHLLEANAHLKNLLKTDHLSDARHMFDKMPQRNEISWTTMISGYVNASDSSQALVLFSDMWVDPALRMDPFIVSLALKACGHDLNVKLGELLHGYSVKSGLWNSVFVGSSVLDMYTKCGSIELGCRVFSEMPVKNVVSWTAIITGLVRGGYNKEGLIYFSEMWGSDVHYDSYTFAIALKACADSVAWNRGREIHTQIIKRGFDTSSFVANSLSTMYNKCGKLDYGLRLFRNMRTPDVVSWTTMITTFVQMGQEENAIQAFISMRESNAHPNEYTFAAVISGCANLTRVKWGEQLHAHILIIGFVSALSIANSIVTMYSRCGLVTSALTVFHEMTRRDVVSWSTIISGHAQGGYGEEALELLSRMRSEGPKPTEFALASVLSVCGSMAILEQGKQLHAHVLSVGLENTAMVRSALVNMYSKCGSIEEASRIFNEKRDDDMVSWTAMINGYAEHGYSHEAIDLFAEISKFGMKPDPVTFIGVLCACSHAGLVDLGFHYFNSMSKDYQINPSKEHYGCMIDLLCRAGRLSDAEHMIQSMPCEQDDVVWSTLLRASRVHGDVECGRRAAKKLLEVDPNCAGTHISLANIYSSKGRWREAAGVRKLMRSKGVIKEPGWSWIKLKDRVSAFVAGDRLHPHCEEIYNILDLLASRTDVSDYFEEIAISRDLED